MAPGKVLSSEDTAPSSPPARALFSDEAERSSSPPSSPPGFPWELQEDATKTKTQRSNAFSMLGKRKALEPISENVRSKKRRASAPSASSNTARPKPLTQLRMSLGQEVQRTCKTCGMEYVPSLPEDRALHDKYHKQYTEGYDLGKDFVKKNRPHSVYEDTVSGDWVCSIGSTDRPQLRKRALEVLEIVQRDLGAVETALQDGWRGKDADSEKYKAYLYLRGTKCIGFLLVKRIQRAYIVKKPALPEEPRNPRREDEDLRARTTLEVLKAKRVAATEREQQLLKRPLILSKTPHAASLGVSRIWTSAPYRHHAIATRLLDVAIERHSESSQLGRGEDQLVKDPEDEGSVVERERLNSSLPSGIQGTIAKDVVAFSQPTEAGTRLARKWFGKPWGWSVYAD